MNTIWRTFFIFLFALLLSSPFAFAAPSHENCVDEVCDGLDNDCDKSVDDNADCGDTRQCGCAHCNEPIVDGKCAQGVPWQGYCLEDFCPPETACNLKTGKCRPAGGR